MSRFRLRLASLLVLLLVTSSVAVQPPLVAAQGTVRLVVEFRPGTSQAHADRAAARGGGRIVDRVPQLGAVVVELPAAAVANARAGWASDPQVAGVETDGTVQATWTPSDPLWGYQWEQRQVRTPKAWNLTRGRKTVVVAVVDTGVQPSHPDLANHLLDGRDFVNKDNNSKDDNGHGTAVAGVIGALAANGVGVAGGCNRCRILPVKVLDSSGGGYWSVAAKGIIWAADQGAHVINLSFGGPTGSSTLAGAVAYARSKGAVVVAAAGNNGTSGYFYPAAYSGVISVAASTDMDLRYSWSNYSSGWVTLAAPGCTWTSKWWNTYGSFCGTSAAAPVVASIAGLVKSMTPTLTSSNIETILRKSGVQTPYSITVRGRIDAFAAVYRAAYGTEAPRKKLKPSAPLLADGTRLELLSGDHIGYRFDRHGAILAATRISLASTSGAVTSKRRQIPNRAGHWFWVEDGSLARYWIRESSRVYLAPEPPTDELLPSAPLLDPAIKVTLKPGEHVGHRFDRSGTALSKKRLVLDATSRAGTIKVARVPNRGKTWFYIADGALAGHWLRASNSVKLKSDPLPARSSSTRLEPADPLFKPAQRVRLAAGEHVGVRFATDGTVLSRRTITLAQTSGANATKWMQIPGRDGRWLYIVDGGLAGYWVRQKATRYLVP